MKSLLRFAFLGNEARHFTIKDNTAANQAAGIAPAPVVYTYTNIDGLSFVGKSFSFVDYISSYMLLLSSLES